MKKAILRILLIICGLNVFTSCYGMPPGEWTEPALPPEEQSQTKTSTQTDEVCNVEKPDETEANS